MTTPGLNTILEQYPSWNLGIRTQPKVLHSLTAGLTNTSYVIEADERKFKLRINAVNSVELGIDREREASILSCLGTLGVTPRQFYNAPEYLYSVFDFIDGKVWCAEDLALAHNKDRLAQTITKYQNLNFDGSARDYIQYLRNYEKQISIEKLEHNEWTRFQRFMQEMVDTRYSWPRPVICHHDLIADNIIESNGRLYILDWEYAALGWGELDFLSTGLHDRVHHPLSEELNYWLNTLWFLVNQRE